MARPITQAVVLAGGFGTRLGALTRDTPKPLLTVAGRPFIDYLIRALARSGIEDVILSTGYLPDAFDAFLAERTWKGPYGNPIRVRNLREPAPAGTAGALKMHEAELAPRFLLVNGDSYFDCDLARLIAAGEALDDGDCLLTAREVPDVARYGGLKCEGSRIVAFLEKSQSGPGLINAGLTVLDREVVARIMALPCSIESQIYPALAAEGRLRCLPQSGYFIDIGLPETYERAQTEMPAALRRPALFLDRDGVLNEDTGYVHRIDEFRWLMGAADAIGKARAAGYLIVVVTNQAGVARGKYDEKTIERLHRHINAELRRQGLWIDAFYYCPYHPEGVVEAYRRVHDDRKPGPGMILKALTDLDIDRERSLLVGDQPTDVAAAEAAGLRGILLDGKTLGEAIAEDIS